MEFIADWQTINNPNMLTHIGIAAAIVITGTLAVPIYRTAKKTNRIKPQSFLLLILPATLIFGGTQLDDVRSDRHQQQLQPPASPTTAGQSSKHSSRRTTTSARSPLPATKPQHWTP